MKLGLRRPLAWAALFNLLGHGVPLLVAFLTIPTVIRGLGADRFGVLTLIWSMIGYFGLFDLGLGRALTQLVAARFGEGTTTRAPALVWPALGLMLVLGLAGTLVVSLAAQWLVHSALQIPPDLQREALLSFYILAATIPAVVTATGFVGILTAFHRFGTLNAIRIPFGVYAFAAPVAMLPFSNSLVVVTALLGIGRLLACIVYLVASRRFIPPLPTGVSRADVSSLFHFGAWMTVSNIISPLLQYLDRFFIGAFFSVAAVAYYAMPFEFATRLLILPGAVLGVLFPAFAASYLNDQPRLVALYTRGTKYIALIMFPVILLLVAFAHEGLSLWLGSGFADQSAAVLQWLAIGVYLNSIAQVFFALVQGAGRPDLSAKLHAVELTLYVGLLWWAVQHYGILGAAIAWTVRVALDGAGLFWISSRFLGENARLLRRTAAAILVALAALLLPLLGDGLAPRVAVVLVTLGAFVPVTWFWVLTDAERRKGSAISWVLWPWRPVIIKRVVAVFKAESVGGVIRAVIRRIRTPQATTFSQCRVMVEGKTGLEIGGPSPLFASGGLIPVYTRAERVDNCNFAKNTIWEGAIAEGDSFVFHPRKPPGKQYVVEGANLRAIADGTYDFVLSSHMLEHTANPMRVLREWSRVLKPDGSFILVVPHRDGTFDHRRPVTTLHHILDDEAKGTGEDDLTHLPEILELHDLARDPGAADIDFRARAERNAELRTLHHHVFDSRLAVDVVTTAGFEVVAVEPLRPYHILVLARKPAGAPAVFSDAALRRALSASPFATDRASS